MIPADVADKMQRNVYRDNDDCQDIVELQIIVHSLNIFFKESIYFLCRLPESEGKILAAWQREPIGWSSTNRWGSESGR